MRYLYLWNRHRENTKKSFGKDVMRFKKCCEKGLIILNNSVRMRGQVKVTDFEQNSILVVKCPMFQFYSLVKFRNE